MLNSRQTEILKIIENYPVSGQKELIDHLAQRGISATQATVSRDIRRLRLKKERTKNPDGTVTVRYVAQLQPALGASFARLESLCRSSLISAEDAQNIVVLKTDIGMAQAVCAAFDAVGFENVIGSIAGDDTIFIVCKTNDDAQDVISVLNKAAKKE